ncbi:MAG: aminopeptidase P family protein [Planctomycetota bacterium]|nr:MAG: aminopeptidase P family protein [Planctomycetota bacterium]
MRNRDDMTFSMAEYERRLGELRQRMQQRLLDAVIISDPENLMYLTDYQTTGYSFFQALIVPLEGDPVMVTRGMEESNVIQRTWVEKTQPYPDIGDAIQTVIGVLKGMGLSKADVGYERNSYFFPAYQQDRIHTSFTDGRLIDCFGIVEQGRIRKSSEEIAVMRKAALATEAGMRAGFAATRAGVTENDIGAAIAAAMFTAGGEPPAVMPYVTSGPRSMIGHATWEGRVVQPGEHVFLEVGGCYRRYHTAMMRTVLLDDISSSMLKAQERMMRALEDVESAIRPGLTVSDADNIVRDIIADNDIGAKLITRSGYSIGIAFPPSWDEGYILSLMQGDSTILEEGMTFHLIPWMWGVDGDKTVGISDSIYVTERGCQSFFSMEREFVCKPEEGSMKAQEQEQAQK